MYRLKSIWETQVVLMMIKICLFLGIVLCFIKPAFGIALLGLFVFWYVFDILINESATRKLLSDLENKETQGTFGSDVKVCDHEKTTELIEQNSDDEDKTNIQELKGDNNNEK